MEMVSATDSQSESDSEAVFGFPGVSIYRRSKYLCFNDIVHVDGVNRCFLYSWEYQPLIPIFTFILAGCLLLYSYHFIFSYWNMSYFGLALALTALSLLCFVRTIFEGPGYFPFYWAHQIGSPLENTSEEYLISSSGSDPAGIISNSDQLDWARSQPKPPRSIVSRTARRIVIRPDHYCIWCCVWIGKKNMKQFILFTLYGFLLSLLYAFGCCRLMYQHFCVKTLEGGHFFSISLCTAASMYFALFTGSFCLVSIINTLQGTTSWERTKKIPRKKFSRGIAKDMADVCGSNPLLWMLPVPAFPHSTSSSLVEGYASYYDTSS